MVPPRVGALAVAFFEVGFAGSAEIRFDSNGEDSSAGSAGRGLLWCDSGSTSLVAAFLPRVVLVCGVVVVFACAFVVVLAGAFLMVEDLAVEDLLDARLPLLFVVVAAFCCSFWVWLVVVNGMDSGW